MAKAKSSIPKPITRQVVEAQIDLLIDMLNDLDADSDMEPSLGWPDSPYQPAQAGYGFTANGNAGDDREHEDEREPDPYDEPTGGWANEGDQASPRWIGTGMGGMLPTGQLA